MSSLYETTPLHGRQLLPQQDRGLSRGKREIPSVDISHVHSYATLTIDLSHDHRDARRK
jgi:hypothetical protein